MRTFSLGEFYGGPDTAHLNAHGTSLRKVFSKFDGITYSPDLVRYDIFLGVGGEISPWPAEGVGRVALYRRSGEIFGEIGLPKERWQTQAPKETRLYLAQCLRELFARFVARIEKARIEFDRDRFLRDTNALVDEFELEMPPYPKSPLQQTVDTAIETVQRLSSERTN